MATKYTVFAKLCNGVRHGPGLPVVQQPEEGRPEQGPEGASCKLRRPLDNQSVDNVIVMAPGLRQGRWLRDRHGAENALASPAGLGTAGRSP